MSQAKNIVVLWDAEVSFKGAKPFEDDNFNETYRYFSELVSERGHKFFVSHYNRYKNGGLQEAYSYSEGWTKNQDLKVDVVFDKYKFDEKTILIKQEIESRHPVVNRFELEKIAKDKLLCAQEFVEHHPETLAANKENVQQILDKYGKAVVKPVYDFGGNGVAVIEDISEFEEKKNFLVQQFVDSTTGIEELGIEGVHDLRVVLVNGEPVLSYVRQPESGYISNVSMGGSMEFIDLEDVPESAMTLVQNVSETLSGFQPAIFGVDMIFDENQKPWILELNSKPGLNFYRYEQVKAEKKKYMEETVEVLCSLAEK